MYVTFVGHYVADAETKFLQAYMEEKDALVLKGMFYIAYVFCVPSVPCPTVTPVQPSSKIRARGRPWCSISTEVQVDLFSITIFIFQFI